MQENEFEARIRKEMEALQLIPAEAVWKNVAASIQKEKRKRRFLVMLFFFTLLAALGGWYFYSNLTHTLPALAGNIDTSAGISLNKKDKISQDKVNKADSGITGVSHSSTISLSAIKKPIIEQITSKQPVIHQSIYTRSKSQAALIINQAEVKNINNKLRGDNSALTSSSLKSANTTVITFKEPQPKQTIAAISQNKANEPETSAKQRLTAQSSSGKKIIPTLADSVKEVAIAVTAETKKDIVSTSALEAKTVEKIKAAPNKKWNIGFSIFTGISNNLSRFALFSGTNADYASAIPSSISTRPGAVNSSLSKLTYKSNFSYGLGLYLKKQLSKTIFFSAGISYHFVSATSLAGSKNNTTRTIYDTTLGNSITINESYNSGQSVNYRNKYYLLELPLSMLIRLNKNQSKPILLTAGLAPAYLTGSNALYADAYQNVYYTNNNQFKKWLLTAQAGFQFTITNAPGFGVTIGPKIQYGFNNMAKSATSTNQHIFSAGLQANINLK